MFLHQLQGHDGVEYRLPITIPDIILQKRIAPNEMRILEKMNKYSAETHIVLSIYRRQ